MTAARRAAVTVALVLLAAALIAEIGGHLQARLLLWIAAAAIGVPPMLHAALFTGPPNHHDPARPAVRRPGDPPAPHRPA